MTKNNEEAEDKLYKVSAVLTHAYGLILNFINPSLLYMRIDYALRVRRNIKKKYLQIDIMNPLKSI